MWRLVTPFLVNVAISVQNILHKSQVHLQFCVADNARTVGSLYTIIHVVYEKIQLQLHSEKAQIDVQILISEVTLSCVQ
jgi:hypothetical protein